MIELREDQLLPLDASEQLPIAVGPLEFNISASDAAIVPEENSYE